MSSSLWSIASIKKSILFDVILVMDRANRIKSHDILRFEYSLLKTETVKKYDILYKAAKNQNELLTAAFCISKKKIHGKHDTVIYSYLFDKALDMVSFNEMIKFLEKSKAEDVAYHIAAMCLSTKEKDVSKDEIVEIVKQGDMNLIEVLNQTTMPEKVKMSIYIMIFNYEEFLSMLIKYMKKLHTYISNLYLEYACIFKRTKKVLINFLKKNRENVFIMKEIPQKVNDEKQRTQLIVLSLVRLEYNRVKHADCTVYYNKGFFTLQRVIHNSEFTIF